MIVILNLVRSLMTTQVHTRKEKIVLYYTRKYTVTSTHTHTHTGLVTRVGVVNVFENNPHLVRLDAECTDAEAGEGIFYDEALREIARLRPELKEINIGGRSKGSDVWIREASRGGEYVAHPSPRLPD
jgi:hypothetical protein